MTFDPSPTNASPAASPPQRAKYRLRFRKAGHLRLVSHHDLMHCFERMLRRANLPICTTQGFHPQPRMIFAQSLALGVVGSAEVVELEMSEALVADEVLARLVAQAPPGLEFLSIRTIDWKASAQVRRAWYRLEVPGARAAGLADACIDLCARPDEVWVERIRPRPRRFDLRLYLSRLAFRAPYLEMALWVSPFGSARPEEVARALGLEALLDEGAHFDRYDLELIDEVPADDREAIPAALMRPAAAAECAASAAPGPADKKAAQPTTLISGPLSFDS